MVINIEMDYINWNTTFPSLTICYKNSLNESALEMLIKYVIYLNYIAKRYHIFI